jgi:hypothetical protein
MDTAHEMDRTAYLLDEDCERTGETIEAPAEYTWKGGESGRTMGGDRVILQADGRRSISAVVIRIGAHWSSQATGESGWYVTAAVPADWPGRDDDRALYDEDGNVIGGVA